MKLLSKLNSPKSYTLRFRSENKDIFDAIKSGKKPIETRAATSKYSGIKAGDALILVCESEKVSKRVASAKIYKSVASLTRAIPPEHIHPDAHSAKDLTEIYNTFPQYPEKIKEFGIIALRLE